MHFCHLNQPTPANLSRQVLGTAAKQLCHPAIGMTQDQFKDTYKNPNPSALSSAATHSKPLGWLSIGIVHLKLGNYDEAIRFINMAANVDFGPALGCLGDAYRFGWGHTTNIYQACRYYREAVKFGDVDSLRLLENLAKQQGEHKKIFEGYYRDTVQEFRADAATTSSGNI